MDGIPSHDTGFHEAICRRMQRWLERLCAATVFVTAQTAGAQLLPPVVDDWARGGLTDVEGWTLNSNNAGRSTLTPGEALDRFDVYNSPINNTGTFFCGNTYVADVAATLLGHEFYLARATPAEVTFCVYESVNTNGPFACVDAVTAHVPAGAGFVSSGQRGVPLRIDKFYAIGVAVTEAASYQRPSADTLPVDCGALTCVKGVSLGVLPTNAVASFTTYGIPHRQRLRLADTYDYVPSKGTSTSPLSTSFMRGNLLAPTNNAWLLGHGLHVARTTAKTLNLFVYESATRTGTYSRVDLQSVTVPAATNFVSATTQIPLTAGRFYLVGGQCASSMTLEYDDDYYATPRNLGWGYALEGFSQSGSPPATVTKLAATTNETVYSACFIVGDRPAVRMDTSAVSMSTNSLTVVVSSAGYSDLTLAFDYRESGDDPQAGDGVFASANGTTFTRVLAVDGTLAWKHYATNIIALAQAAGVSTSSNLYLRLQQMDENPWPTDGREYANVRVYAKPDLAWQALDLAKTNYLIRGSVAKTFALTGTVRLAGGTNAVDGLGVSVRHQLCDPQGAAFTTNLPYTADIPALGHRHDPFASAFTVPAGTLLTQSYYYAEATLDSSGALAEGREDNNVETHGCWVNNYSGILRFGNTPTSIILTNWTFQTGCDGSPVLHLITGMGLLDGRPFGFTNLMVRKQMGSGDYVIDPDELQFFTLPGLIGTTSTVAGVTFGYRGQAVLSRNGVTAPISVVLPAGCAFAGGPDRPWGVTYAESEEGVQLDASLLPTGAISFPPPDACFFEESKPLYFTVNTFTWNPAAGTFTLPVLGVAYAHDSAFDALEALAGTGEIAWSNAVRRTNDGYYRSVTNATNLILSSDTHGAAQLSFSVGLATNTFRTHFPYDVALGWNDLGTLTVTNDRPNVSQSVSLLNGGLDFSVSYSTGVPGACAAGTNTLPLNCLNDAKAFYFTRDGGLYVPCGFAGAAADLRWGYIPSKNAYAQRAHGFTDGVLHVPGHFLCVDDCPGPLSDDDTPGALLLTAVGGAGDELTRPLGAGYIDGDGSHAGVTVQRQDPTCDGETLVGGSSLFGPYDLAPGCKLYVRHSGVSGTHVADASYNPPPVTLYGYPFVFDTFAFAYLSNVNRGSRTSGGLTVPAPGDFDIDFAELRLNGFGDVESAVPAGPKGEIELAYWSAEVLPSSLQFAAAAACQVGGRILTMDVSTKVASIPEKLFGRLGFLSNGNLSSGADAGAVCDSRLALPRTVTLPGPSGSRYTLRPVGKAYLNDFRSCGGLSATGDGLLTFMGELDVPFFENLLVQAFTSARPGGTPPTYLVGGWPTKGWKINGQTPFAGTAFDTNNAAHPTGGSAPSFSDYLAGANTDYIPRARREWMAGIGFDVGVRWDPASRSFRSPAPKTSDLIVLQTEYNVPQLNAERAEITFGMQYGELPALNLSSALFNAVDEATGISKLLTDLVGNVVSDALDSGVGALSTLTATDPTDMLGNALADQLDPFVDTLYDGLTNAYARGESVTNVIVSHVRGGGGVSTRTLRELLGTLADGAEGVGAGLGIAEDLQGRLDTALNMLDAVAVGVEDPNLGITISLLDQDADGDFTWLEALANMLLLFAVPAMEDGGGALAESIGEIMDTLKPTLETARETLLEVRGQLQSTRAALDSGGEFRDELRDLLDPAQLDALTNAVIARLEGELANLGNAFSPRTNYTPEELKARLRGALLDALREASPIAQVQRAIRARMVDVDRQVRDGVDSVMGQINQAMRDALSEVVGSLDSSLSGMSGALADVIGTGQIEGYAHIQGDSLDKLRLDLAMQLKVPEEMQFAGFLEINNEQTRNSGGCAFAEGETYKVTLGANDVSCNWLGSDLRINCSCFFTLNQVGSTVLPKGMGGGIELVGGSIKFGTLEAQRFAAAVAFGQLENYLAASARLVMNGSTVIEGGLFFGRTCNITPLLIVDPEAQTVLGQPPFTGAYVYGEGWIPIYDYGCTFRIRAGAGFGVFYFVEGPTYGMRALLGATGEALCVFTVSGVVELRGVKQGDAYRARGKGRFKGQVGSCPFCLKFGKTVTITYDDGEWDADY
jgi:hypothetical protein